MTQRKIFWSVEIEQKTNPGSFLFSFHSDRPILNSSQLRLIPNGSPRFPRGSGIRRGRCCGISSSKSTKIILVVMRSCLPKPGSLPSGPFTLLVAGVWREHFWLQSWRIEALRWEFGSGIPSPSSILLLRPLSHSTPLQYSTVQYTPVHSTPFHSTPVHSSHTHIQWSNSHTKKNKRWINPLKNWRKRRRKPPSKNPWGRSGWHGIKKERRFIIRSPSPWSDSSQTDAFSMRDCSGFRSGVCFVLEKHR